MDPLSQHALARYLNELGHTIRVRQARCSYHQVGGPRPFEVLDMRRILRQRLYLGFYSRGEKKLSKWVRDEGPVKAYDPELRIVDVTTWRRVEALLKERAGTPGQSWTSTRPLAGLLRCPKCGGLMSTSVRPSWMADGRRVIYGRYQGANRRFGSKTCTGAYLPEVPARRAVETLLLEHLESLCLDEFLERTARDEKQRSTGDVGQGIAAELVETETKLDRLVRAVADGALSPADVRNVNMDLLEKRERLETRLANLQKRTQARNELAEAVSHVQHHLPAVIAGLDGARFGRLARLVFDHVVVESRGGGGHRTAAVLHFELTQAFGDLALSSRSLASASIARRRAR